MADPFRNRIALAETFPPPEDKIVAESIAVGANYHSAEGLADIANRPFELTAPVYITVSDADCGICSEGLSPAATEALIEALGSTLTFERNRHAKFNAALHADEDDGPEPLNYVIPFDDDDPEEGSVTVVGFDKNGNPLPLIRITHNWMGRRHSVALTHGEAGTLADTLNEIINARRAAE